VTTGLRGEWLADQPSWGAGKLIALTSALHRLLVPGSLLNPPGAHRRPHPCPLSHTHRQSSGTLAPCPPLRRSHIDVCRDVFFNCCFSLRDDRSVFPHRLVSVVSFYYHVRTSEIEIMNFSVFSLCGLSYVEVLWEVQTPCGLMVQPLCPHLDLLHNQSHRGSDAVLEKG